MFCGFVERRIENGFRNFVAAHYSVRFTISGDSTSRHQFGMQRIRSQIGAVRPTDGAELIHSNLFEVGHIFQRFEYRAVQFVFTS
jgi:hypothetical protein